MGSIPGLGTKIQHATGKLESPCAATRKACGLQERPVQPKEKEKRKLGGLKKKKKLNGEPRFVPPRAVCYL